MQANEEAAARIIHLIRNVCRTPTTETYETTVTVESQRNHHNLTNWSCAIEVGKNVTDEFELNWIWVVFDPIFLEHLANITNCSSDGDADTVQACTEREQLATRATYVEFLASVREVRLLSIEKKCFGKCIFVFASFAG